MKAANDAALRALVNRDFLFYSEVSYREVNAARAALAKVAS